MAGVRAGFEEHRGNAGARSLRDAGKPVAHEEAVLPREGHNIRHGADSGKVAVHFEHF